MASEHAVVVLAAGASRRLGLAKQLLRIEGETLVHRAARIALATRPAQAIAVLGSREERIREAVADLEIRPCLNRDWESGAASSIACARRALAPFDGPILILGCDQPALAPGMLRALLAAARDAASGCSASAYAGTVGSPAVISPARFFDCAAPQRDAGFGSMLRGLNRAELGVVEAPELELDLDTQDDLERALSLGLIDRWD